MKQINNSKPGILIVGEVNPNRLAMIGILEGDYRVIAATTGEKALELANHFPAPDLVLLDSEMPDSGMVLHQLKNNLLTTGIPVILVNAHFDSADEEQAVGIKMGAADIFHQSIQPDLLKQRIAVQLELHRQRTEASISDNQQKLLKIDRPLLLWMADAPEALQGLVAGLKPEYRIRLVRNSLQALDMVQGQNPPDLILLDIVLPERVGYEVCRQIKATAVGAQIPVILVSQMDIVTEKSLGFSSGAADYITKPFDMAEVRVRVRTHLDMTRYRQHFKQLLDMRTNALRHLEAIVNRSPVVAITRQNVPDWPITYVSENIAAWGYRANNLLAGKLKYIDLIHPDDQERIGIQVNQCICQGPDEFRQEYRLMHGNGQWLWLEDFTRLTRNEDGEVVLIDGLLNDITKRVEAEQSLREREAQLRIMGDNLPDGYIYRYKIEQNSRSSLQYISAGVEKLHGFTAAQLCADIRPLFAQMAPESLQEYLSAEAECLKELKIFKGTLLFNLPDGTERWLTLQSSPQKQPDGSVIWDGVGIDVTQRIQDEQRLVLLAKRSQALLKLPQKSETLTETEFMQHGQELAEDFTGSLIAFIHFVNEDQESIELVTWSRRTLEHFCHASYEKHYPISQAGIWADALRTRKPVIFNDYANYPAKRGLPEGHSELRRLISIPVIENGKVVMLTGVGNKATDYNELDVETVQLISNDIWRIVQRRRIEQKAARFSHVLERSTNEIYIFDSKTLGFVDVNQGAQSNLGYSIQELEQMTPLDIKTELSTEEFNALLDPLRSGMKQRSEYTTVHRRKDGSVYPVEVHVEITDDQPPLFVAIVNDLTKTRQMQERITQLSRYDSVTGLPNQFFFEDLLSLAISEAEHEGYQIVVMCLDIVNFHRVDDSYGFKIGDQTLKVIASRLVKTAGTEGIVTRMSKDNFNLVHPRINDVLEAKQLAENLQARVLEPVILGQHEIHLEAKIGISFYPSDGLLAHELVQRAGIALTEAKNDKLSNLRFFEREMNELLLSKIALTNDIRHAIEREEFELYYQPQVELTSGALIGLEALVRWNHPVLGFLPPAKFIELAEESGLIVPLGDWILKRAILQAKEWLDAGLTDNTFTVAINASAMQMQTGNLVDLMKKLLDETGLAAQCVDLELTESLLMSDVSETQNLLKRLKDMGVQLSIDDFGTGYSSLSYLKQFSVDKLKIDKSFIDHVTSDPNDAVIVQATIAMAHSIGLTVVAEGVETQAQASYLRTLHCDQIQGYYFSRPLPAAEIWQLLQSSPKLNLPFAEQKPTVLLVDDEPNILSALRRVLRRDGYEILTAQSGEEALEIMAHHRVMVILSDQRMPNMTGTEFLSRVKVLHPRTVRIILSGYADLDSITEAINKGEIYKFRTKPWDDEELRNDVREAFIHFETLERRKSEQPIR